MSQAANLLGVTENTVRQRRLGAYSQFGAENATQAIARAFEFRYYRSLETHEQVALFGLMDVLRPAGPTEGELTSSVAYEAVLNRPPLVVVDNPTGRLGNGVERPLSVGARRRIERRAGALVTNPFQSEYTFAELQVKHVQALTDGLAQGKTQAQVARTLGVSLDVISRADGPAKRLRDHLGTNNPADTMYSMLLHGYRPADIELPPGSSPKLLQNMVLHLYLAALGYDTPNAMELTQHDKRVVVYNRKQAIDRLGARTLQQAVAHAFALGIFRSLPVANYRLAA
jgi:DNA-binding CsgD family transcriptional regulator